MTPALLPLLCPRDLAAPLAWQDGRPLSAGRFIALAQALAERLPARGQPVNLCQDRLRFALGLAAALLRGHTSLLPPNALPETLRRLQDDAGPGQAYAFTDDDTPGLDLCGLPRVVVDPAALLPAGAPDAREVPGVPAALEAARLLTSGSTGAPQPHGKCWGQLVLNIAAEAERLAEHLGAPSLAGLTVVATVPAQHSYGFESTVLLALLGGAAFDAGRPFYPADVADALASVPAPRALVTTPFHLKTLLLAGVPLPATALTLSATAPLSPQLAAQAEAALQGLLVEIYGCTEAGQVASRRTTAGETWTTLGALRIRAEGGGDDPGQEERFLVSGGHVLEPTPLADVLVLEDDREAARRFRLLGRANDLIHVAGKRSSLAHLNYHLNRIAGLDDGAFWLPDAEGEAVVRPVAFVVAPTLTSAQVIAGLRERLEPQFVPRRVLQVEALPREATGKLTAAAMRTFALQHLQQGASTGSGSGSGSGSGVAATPAPADAACGLALAPGHPQLQADGSASASWAIAADHPAFAGHFPGRPLLPGVVLLSLVLETLARAPALQQRLGAAAQVDNAKFLAPVGPGASVQVLLRPAAGSSTGVAFELSAGGTPVARGLLRAAGTGAPP